MDDVGGRREVAVAAKTGEFAVSAQSGEFAVAAKAGGFAVAAQTGGLVLVEKTGGLAVVEKTSVTGGRPAPSMGENVLVQQSEMLEREWQRMLADERAKGTLPTSAAGIAAPPSVALLFLSTHLTSCITLE